MRVKIYGADILRVTSCLPRFTHTPEIPDQTKFNASNHVINHCTLVQHFISHGKDPKDSNAAGRLDCTSRVHAHSEYLKVAMGIPSIDHGAGDDTGRFYC